MFYRDAIRAFDAVIGEVEAAGDDQKKTAWVGQAWHRRPTWVRWLQELKRYTEGRETMALARIVEAESQQKELDELRSLASEFVRYWTTDRTPDGCGMCGGIPHSTTCYVGRMAALVGSGTQDPSAERSADRTGAQRKEDTPNVPSLLLAEPSERIVQPSVEAIRSALNGLSRLINEDEYTHQPEVLEAYRLLDQFMQLTAVTAAHQQEIEQVKQLVADLNNELKGSHGFFLGSPSLVDDVRELKLLANKRYRQIKEQAETITALEAEIARLKGPHIGGDGVPEGSCLLCGHRHPFSTWTWATEKLAVGVCQQCRRCAEARLTAVELEHTDPPESSLHSHNPKFRCPQCGSGNQATPEHSASTNRSAAPKPSSSPSLTPVDQQRPAHEHD